MPRWKTLKLKILRQKKINDAYIQPSNMDHITTKICLRVQQWAVLLENSNWTELPQYTRNKHNMIGRERERDGRISFPCFSFSGEGSREGLEIVPDLFQWFFSNLQKAVSKTDYTVMHSKTKELQEPKEHVSSLHVNQKVCQSIHNMDAPQKSRSK